MKKAGVLWLWLACSCARAAAPSPAAPTTASASASTETPAPPVSATPPGRLAGHIEFIEDDYARALAEARERRLPLFVDAWATWCHTCLSLRSYVFPDPAFRSLAGRFVWLSIDTERQQNEAIVKRLAVRVLPTLFVLDPSTEQPAWAWPGSLTAPELAGLLEEVLAGGSLGGRPQGPSETDDRALARAPRDPEKRAPLVDALVTRLSEEKRFAPCATRAAAEAEAMPPGSFRADVLRAGIGCAREVPSDRGAAAALDALLALGARVAPDPADPMLADDRSDLYDYLVEALRALERGAEATRMARSWAAFLEEQAARAPTPAARAVFDAHRVLAYQALGEPGRAVPALEQSERDFPRDYNPPARLATVYLAMGRHDDALAAVNRALTRAYGPRKLRLYAIESDVFLAKGDVASARDALRAALDFARGAALGPGYERLRDSLAEKLARLQ